MKSWGQVNRALGWIAGTDRRIARIQGDVARLKARRERWEEKMEAFVRAHESELDGRSRQLGHGRVWLKAGTKLVSRNWGKVLAWLQERGRHELIRKNPEVDKEALGKALADPDQVGLQTCGARLKSGDAFGYEAR